MCLLSELQFSPRSLGSTVVPETLSMQNVELETWTVVGTTAEVVCSVCFSVDIFCHCDSITTGAALAQEVERVVL